MKILRWFLVLPGAILAGLIANVLVYYLFQSKLWSIGGGGETYRELVSSLFSYLALSLIYVSAGAYIAPSNKSKVAMGLAIFFTLFAIGFLIFQIINSEFLSIPTASMIVAILGSFFGYLSVLESKE